MLSKSRHFSLIVLALGMLVAGAVVPRSASFAADSFTDAQKAELRNFIKDYIKENPDIVVQALQSYQQKQEDEVRAMAESRVADNQEAITGKDLPSAGSPDGDVTVTEFYDYNCGYCKHAVDDIEKVLGKDKNVRFIFKELPILGPTSGVAAQWSMAAQKQGKFFEYHKTLMRHNGEKNEQALEKAAKDAGLDVDKLRLDANSVEIRDSVNKSRQLAMDLQIQGTPGFIINGKLFRGYMGLEGLEKAIEDARKDKKKN